MHRVQRLCLYPHLDDEKCWASLSDLSHWAPKFRSLVNTSTADMLLSLQADCGASHSRRVSEAPASRRVRSTNSTKSERPWTPPSRSAFENVALVSFRNLAFRLLRTASRARARTSFEGSRRPCSAYHAKARPRSVMKRPRWTRKGSLLRRVMRRSTVVGHVEPVVDDWETVLRASAHTLLQVRGRRDSGPREFPWGRLYQGGTGSLATCSRKSCASDMRGATSATGADAGNTGGGAGGAGAGGAAGAGAGGARGTEAAGGTEEGRAAPGGRREEVPTDTPEEDGEGSPARPARPSAAKERREPSEEGVLRGRLRRSREISKAIDGEMSLVYLSEVIYS
mmetsp:Transcript_33958/g.82516  ORF Transcript_33958/g.82516 Transcript_33958/m.82516 type:complete len:339 (+) Transcript_33958:919-1935(+)